MTQSPDGPAPAAGARMFDSARHTRDDSGRFAQMSHPETSNVTLVPSKDEPEANAYRDMDGLARFIAVGTRASGLRRGDIVRAAPRELPRVVENVRRLETPGQQPSVSVQFHDRSVVTYPAEHLVTPAFEDTVVCPWCRGSGEVPTGSVEPETGHARMRPCCETGELPADEAIYEIDLMLDREAHESLNPGGFRDPE